MRPVIIGMNNPLSDDPRAALWPDPPGCTGWRLWQMLHERTGASQRDYLRAFERRNLLVGKHWDPVAARAASEGLWEALEGRTVLLLGQDVRRVLWLPREPELLWRSEAGVTWCSVPHPSGLNRWYNDQAHAAAVGLRLEELYERGRDHVVEMAD